MWSARRYDQMCRVAADFQRGVGPRLQLLLAARNRKNERGSPPPGANMGSPPPGANTGSPPAHVCPGQNGLTRQEWAHPCADLRAGHGAREGVAPLRSSLLVPCEYPLSTP